MGTRADFYIGRGENAEWLGSTAWDGYPDGFKDTPLLGAADEATYRAEVAALGTREDFTAPEKGWPWPWIDSRTTDYAYAFDGGKVWCSSFGHPWFIATEVEPEYEEIEDDAKVAFPNMKSRQNVTLGKRSGVTIISVPK